MIGIGLDMCEIARMERLLAKDSSFLQRYFTAEEQAYILSRSKTAAQSMAAMFAAKEALLKAMSIGLGGGLSLNDICIAHTEQGQPYYVLLGPAAEKLQALGGSRALLSLTHEAGIAAAVALIE